MGTPDAFTRLRLAGGAQGYSGERFLKSDPVTVRPPSSVKWSKISSALHPPLAPRSGSDPETGRDPETGSRNRDAARFFTSCVLVSVHFDLWESAYPQYSAHKQAERIKAKRKYGAGLYGPYYLLAGEIFTPKLMSAA